MNRRLVEGATHPERIAAVVEEKGKKWQTYDMKLGGTEAAERGLGDLRRLDRGTAYDEAMFPDLDERILTRLGEEGAVLTLDPPSLGPFGREITRVTLPARWSAGISSEEAKRVEVHPTQEGVTLKVGDRSYGYSRSGVEFPDKAGRDSPVISQTTLVGRNDSPLLMGPDEPQGDE